MDFSFKGSSCSVYLVKCMFKHYNYPFKSANRPPD